MYFFKKLPKTREFRVARYDSQMHMNPELRVMIPKCM